MKKALEHIKRLGGLKAFFQNARHFSENLQKLNEEIAELDDPIKKLNIYQTHEKSVEAFNNLVNDYETARDNRDEYFLQKNVRNNLYSFSNLFATGIREGVVKTNHYKEAVKDPAYREYTNHIYDVGKGIGVEGSDPLLTLEGKEDIFFSRRAFHLIRSMDLLERLITSPAETATREGFDLKIDAPKKDLSEDKVNRLTKTINAELERLRVKDLLKRVSVYSRMFSYGCLVMPVLDYEGQDEDYLHFAQPLDYSRVRYVEGLNVVEPERFVYITQVEDPFKQKYLTIKSLMMQGTQVDLSWVKIIIENIDPYLMRGVSQLDRMLTAIKSVNLAQWSITHLLLKYSCMFLYVDSETKNSLNPIQFKEIVDTIKNDVTAKSITAMPSSFKIEHLDTRFGGIQEALQFLFDYLASITSIPVSIISGQTKNTRSTEIDLKQYHTYLRDHEQEGKYTPILEHIFMLLKHAKFGDLKGVASSMGLEPDDYTITADYRPLRAMSLKEQEELKMMCAQRMSLEINQNRTKTEEEARRECHPELKEDVPVLKKRVKDYWEAQKPEMDFGGGRQPQKSTEASKRKVTDTQKKK